MRPVFQYIKGYFSETNTLVFTLCTGLAALLIFCNYYFDIDGLIRSQENFLVMSAAWYFVFLFALALPYIFYGILAEKQYLSHPAFISLLLLAPLLFALRISITGIQFCAPDTAAVFWRPVINWTVSFFFILASLLLIWYLFNKEQPFYGFKKITSLKPYWLMLLCMLPIIIAAAQQPDFTAQYPRWKIVEGAAPAGWQTALFELSYGSDFLTVELFFRGFLVLAFAKWAGKDAILPMACFYCSIHFAKPLGECISSYFGGLLLGILVYYTRSIWGGLLVHLGIAWLMEVTGHFAQQ
jgi:hypothetical protein